MPRIRHHRRRRLGAILAVGSAIGIGIGVFVHQSTQHGGGGGSLPSTTVANEWVNTSAGSSPRRLATATSFADATGCNSTCAYASFSAAYSAAQCGDSILVKAGSYPAQLIAYTVSKTSGSAGCSAIGTGSGCHLAASWPDGTTQTQDLTMCVFVQPESGASVTLTQTVGSGGTPSVRQSLDVESSYTYLKGFTLTPYAVNGAAGGLYVAGSSVRTATSCLDKITKETIVDGTSGSADANINGPFDNVAIINNDIGPSWDTRTGTFGSSSGFSGHCAGASTNSQSTKLLVRGNTWHDKMVPASGHHEECLHFYNIVGGIIDGNRFLNCDGLNLSIQTSGFASGTYVIDGLYVQNNVFDKACSDPSFGVGDASCGPVNSGVTVIQDIANGINNLQFRFNSFAQSTSPKWFCNNCTGWPPPNSGFYGNVGTTPSVNTSIAAEGYNVVTSAFTGTGNVNFGASIDPIYTNLAARTWNYTLASGTSSVAHAIVPGTGLYTCLPVDILGNARPSTNCTAGAYEP